MMHKVERENHSGRHNSILFYSYKAFLISHAENKWCSQKWNQGNFIYIVFPGAKAEAIWFSSDSSQAENKPRTWMYQTAFPLLI